MGARVLAIWKARLRAHLGGALVPWPTVLAHGSLATVLALLVRDTLGGYGYALFLLALSGGLVCLTLLGELGELLRADPAREWVETLPARDVERRLAHSLLVGALLAGMAGCTLLPAALCAPGEWDLASRVLLVAAGLGQAFLVAAVLLTVQALLGERAEGLLVLLQTALVVVAITGVLSILRTIPLLRALEDGGAAWPAALGFLPPAWYAAVASAPPPDAALPPAWLSMGLAALGILLVLVAPQAPAAGGRASSTLVARLLAPFRALAQRAWVPRGERGVFDLVYDALPLERDFVLRTYPMVGIPLAFLVVGMRGESGAQREGLLALLLFTPAVYLPILLAHVPVTRSPGARWLLDSAPIHPAAVRNATLKAMAVRFLVPLYVVLGALAWSAAGAGFALRLALPGAIVSMLSLRFLYPGVVLAPPLSTAPSEIEVKHDFTGGLFVLVLGLVVGAVAAQRYVTTAPRALALVAALAALELLQDLAERRAYSPGSTMRVTPTSTN